MEKTYETIVTDIGVRLIAQAAAEGKKIDIAYLAVGDGNGAYYKPVPSMTSLKNEKWRGPRNSVSLDAKTPNVIDVVAIVPPDVGGWTIREMCILDTNGNMIAICNTPDTEKTVAAAGATGEVELIMQIKIASAAAVSFAIDPNLITATKEDIARHAADTAAHIATALHTRTGTVNNLSIPDGAKNLTFLATADLADGDTWTVNNQPVTAVLQNGETLPGELFKSGCWVTGVRLSDDGMQLTFPGKSAMRELTIGVGNGGTSATYTGAAAVSITIPRIVVSTSAPSSLLPTGTIHGVY